MINNKLPQIIIFFFFLSSAILFLYPSLDIECSRLFFSEEIKFQHKNQVAVKFFYDAVPILTKIFITSSIIFLLYKILILRDIKKLLTLKISYILLVAAIGPGIIVNQIFKENFARARPREIQEFQGNKTFSSAFIISDQCVTNCSFSSGHAAMAFSFASIAYILPATLFSASYVGFILFGLAVGASRIIAGAHFISDVCASGLIVLGINHLIYILRRIYITKNK